MEMVQFLMFSSLLVFPGLGVVSDTELSAENTFKSEVINYGQGIQKRKDVVPHSLETFMVLRYIL